MKFTLEQEYQLILELIYQWKILLKISGINSKQTVIDEMDRFLKCSSYDRSGAAIIMNENAFIK